MIATHRRQAGFSILETIIGMGILVIVSTAVYLAYSNTLDIVTAGQYYSVAANIIESEVETIRNMRYEDIGVVGGVPAGKLPASRSVTLDEITFVINTAVRAVDDPFDGIFGGTPNDTDPSDYKLVEFEVECPGCPRFGLVRMTTTVAPRNLENASRTGVLLIRSVNAAGAPLPGATVTVVDGAVAPPVNLTDTTDANGELMLYGMATDSAGYRVTVSKNGYSTARTYPPGDPGNPNPTAPDLTIAEEQLTTATFAIDELGALTLDSIDQFCSAMPNMDLLLTGGKLIGNAPDVHKYSSPHQTDGNGILSLGSLEWDAYTAVPTDGTNRLAATSHPSPFLLNPGESKAVTWVVIPASANALLVQIVDDEGTPLNDASVTLSSGSYATTRMTGRYDWQQTDWSGGQFTQQSGGIHTTDAGSLSLEPGSAPYTSSSSYEWLESSTLDLSTASTAFFTLSWAPASQPPASGVDPVRFQVAGNNDGTTWDYIGPDGTPDSFFTSPGMALPSVLSGNRYLRYRVELRTLDESATPAIADISLTYRAGCLPSGGAFFPGVPSDTYGLTVTKTGFPDYNETDVSVTAPWQERTVELSE